MSGLATALRWYVLGVGGLMAFTVIALHFLAPQRMRRTEGTVKIMLGVLGVFMVFGAWYQHSLARYAATAFALLALIDFGRTTIQNAKSGPLLSWYNLLNLSLTTVVATSLIFLLLAPGELAFGPWF